MRPLRLVMVQYKCDLEAFFNRCIADAGNLGIAGPSPFCPGSFRIGHLLSEMHEKLLSCKKNRGFGNNSFLPQYRIFGDEKQTEPKLQPFERFSSSSSGCNSCSGEFPSSE
jgi:hypothetical protein